LFVHEIKTEMMFVPVNGNFCEKKMQRHQTVGHLRIARNADLQSAVSRICNPPGVNNSTTTGMTGALPIANRRYGRLQTCATQGLSF
jgi:hypothetical protein